MRDNIIEEWFHAWFHSSWNQFEKIFDETIQYSESWGPQYQGIVQIKQWFLSWHTHTKLKQWNIKHIIHTDTVSVVEWYFSCCDDKGEDAFDGVSIIEWTSNDKIRVLNEYMSKLPHYNSYSS